MAIKRKEHDFNGTAAEGSGYPKLGYHLREDSLAFHDPETTENRSARVSVQVANCHEGHVTHEDLIVGGMQ
jgi:hypothetical protein